MKMLMMLAAVVHLYLEMSLSLTHTQHTLTRTHGHTRYTHNQIFFVSLSSIFPLVLTCTQRKAISLDYI